MRQRTRQRLIGLLLLLLLAAILAPLVLRSPEQVRMALDMSIPEPPAVDEPRVDPVIGGEEQVATDQQISEEQQAVAEAGEEQAKDEPAEDAPATTQAPAAPSREPSAEQGGGARDEPAPAPAKPDGQDGPRPGFTVQVASFSDAANAEALVTRLRAAGYNAYHRTVSQDGNHWERVFVGPEIKRADAESLRQRLADDKDFALDGLVRTFVP
ncbi:SPOR domain-containing protein [Alloalcanivorax sp. C16-2]|uniref:SPOR domain-containing protein n=1 Tax=Alloalcanivorax sp. C16-2 TaxID=3390052 RepID=UPI003970E072